MTMKTMRKILFTLLLVIVIHCTIMAQGRIAEIWTEPAVFAADEPVSWYFDVTGTALDGETEGVYMWSWFPSEPDAGNWENSSDFAALTQVEGNIWRLDLTPSDYYSVDASTIVAFYGLLKNKDGSKVSDAFAPDQTPRNDIQIYDLSGIKDGKLIEYYPADFTAYKPMSILLNTNNTWSGCDSDAKQGDLANATNVHMHAGVNAWDVIVENNPDNLSKTELTDMGDGIYRMDLTLDEYFGLDDNYELSNIYMVFADESWTYMGKDVACADFVINAPEAPEVIPPELTFFPQKISKKDILVITRTNNEMGVTNLTYTITGGSKTFTGDFGGNSASMVAYIDLVTNLAGVSDIDKITVVISDNKGREIINSDIPLINLTK